MSRKGLGFEREEAPQATVYEGNPGRPDYIETGPCTGPTGEHEFAIGQLRCVFCDRAQRLIGAGQP